MNDNNCTMKTIDNPLLFFFPNLVTSKMELMTFRTKMMDFRSMILRYLKTFNTKSMIYQTKLHIMKISLWIMHAMSKKNQSKSNIHDLKLISNPLIFNKKKIQTAMDHVWKFRFRHWQIPNAALIICFFF